MDIGAIEISVILILALAVLIALIVNIHSVSVRFALRNIRRRKKSLLSVIVSLSIVAAVLTASLCLGDSIRHSMDLQTISNLGEVDECVESLGLFDGAFYTAVRDDAPLQQMIHALAPVMMLKSSSVNNKTGEYSAKTNILGITDDFFKFGSFYDRSGEVFIPDLEEMNDTGVVINDALARELLVNQGDIVRFTVFNPDLSIDTLFSSSASQIEIKFTVEKIVKNWDLGKFQLSPSGLSRNAFVNLSAFQRAFDAGNRINLILISNNHFDGSGVSTAITSRLQTVLSEKVTYSDAGFEFTVTDYLRMDNRNVFFSDRYLTKAQNVIDSLKGSVPRISSISPLCTYFVEGIGCQNSMYAYSTVAGFDSSSDSVFGPFTQNSTGTKITGDLKSGEIIITNYTALNLNASVGSKIYLRYQVINDVYRVKTVISNFTVRYIVDMQGKAKDHGIPPYPGIKGKACNEWDYPYFEMNHSLIFDENYFGHKGYAYWQEWVGAPKAYINLDDAKQLWGNDLGTLTTLKLKPDDEKHLNPAASKFMDAFNKTLDYIDAGLIIKDVRGQNLASSEGVLILIETFTSFGSVVIIGSLIVAAFFMNAIVESRRREIGIVKSLGFRRGGIAASIFLEFTIGAVIASIIGVITGTLVSYFSVLLINEYLPNIVEENVVFYFTPESLLLALAIALTLCIAVIAILSLSFSRIEISRALRSRPGYPATPRGDGRSSIVISILATIVIVATYVLYIIKKGSGTSEIYVFFSIGFIIVFALAGIIILATPTFSRIIFGIASPKINLSLQNISKKKKTSWGMLSVTALVVFTLLSLSIYSSAQQKDLSRLVDIQGGGYQVYGETSTPVMFDLGNENERNAHGINASLYPNDTPVLQFLSFGSPGGTCTNLRKNLPPRIVGMNATFAKKNKMLFYSSLYNKVTDNTANWKDLDLIQPDGSIPAIGDYNTILWILGRNVGDKIDIINENGMTRKLLIVSVLENTVFQGTLFVSEKNIKALYPTKAQYTVFMFETNALKTDALNNLVLKLENALKNYGMDTQSVSDMASENLAVDSAYISIFQALMAVELVLGAISMGIIALRNVWERKYEIGVLRALGLNAGTVSDIIMFEYFYIMLAGVALGVVTSYAVSNILFTIVVMPWRFFILLLFIIVVATLASVLWSAGKASKLQPAEALRIDE